MSPIWGSARDAIYWFQQGDISRGVLNGAMAISDVFLVKGIVTAAAKGSITAAGKYVTKQAVKNPKYVGREAQALANPRVSALMKGKGIDRAFRRGVDNNWVLNPAQKIGLIKINPMNRGADMIGRGLLKGTWWDVTTKGAWQVHVNKYGAGGIGLFY